MSVEETVTRTRFLADADWTDECDVVARMRKKQMRLTPDQAREFAADLVGAAEDAERAAASAVRPVEPAGFDLLGQVRGIAADFGAEVIVNDRLSPDCRADKHPTWHDDAWDNVADVEVPCECSCHTAGAAA